MRCSFIGMQRRSTYMFLASAREDKNVPIQQALVGRPLELSKSPAWAFNWLHDVGMTGAIAFTVIMWWHGHHPELP
jgi:hypothetical protein